MESVQFFYYYERAVCFLFSVCRRSWKIIVHFGICWLFTARAVRSIRQIFVLHVYNLDFNQLELDHRWNLMMRRWIIGILLYLSWFFVYTYDSFECIAFVAWFYLTKRINFFSHSYLCSVIRNAPLQSMKNSIHCEEQRRKGETEERRETANGNLKKKNNKWNFKVGMK